MTAVSANGRERSPKKRRFNRGQLCIPYALFLALFVVLPLMLIIYYAFTARDGKFTFGNVAWFFQSASMLQNLGIIILIGLVTTLLCLLIGYPVAYILSRFSEKKRGILLLLFIAPMWINFVLRALAMREVLELLGLLGKYNYLNTVIGMVYDYLPFMILPLYSTLIKMDRSLEEAAADLGANRIKVFTSVTLPLSLPGIISGITMVFMPTMTCYVISDTFSNFKVTIIGKLIEHWFGGGDNWHYGSVIAVVLLVIMFVSTLIEGRFNEDKGARGTTL